MWQFKKLIDESPNAVIITNKDAKIIYVNRAWEQLTGYAFGEVKGKSPRILQSGKTPKEVYQCMWQTLKAGRPFISESVIDKRKDGSLFHTHSSIFPVKKNKIVYYAQVLHDITDRKQIDDIKNAFLSVAGHELKTPLTTVKLLTQRLMQQRNGSEQLSGSVLASLAIMNKEISRLTTLVNDILDTSRIETGKLALRYEKVYLADFIAEVAMKVSMIYPKYHIRFDKVPQLSVSIDPTRIEQVLVNLLNNAVKHSKEGSIITIYAKEKSRIIKISVHDQGEGIAKEKLPFVFEKFYQATEKPSSGFGIGLYIAKEIIQAHKGTVSVESTIGKGSTFSFSLSHI